MPRNKRLALNTRASISLGWIIAPVCAGVLRPVTRKSATGCTRIGHYRRPVVKAMFTRRLSSRVARASTLEKIPPASVFEWFFFPLFFFFFFTDRFNDTGRFNKNSLDELMLQVCVLSFFFFFFFFFNKTRNLDVTKSSCRDCEKTDREIANKAFVRKSWQAKYRFDNTEGEIRSLFGRNGRNRRPRNRGAVFGSNYRPLAQPHS